MIHAIDSRVLPYAHWLYGIPGVGNASIRRLLGKDRSPLEIYRLSEEGLKSLLPPTARGEALAARIVSSRQKQGEDAVNRSYESLAGKGLHFLCLGHPDYPDRLAQIPDAPYGIYFRGRLPQQEKPAVAVIGARNCSEYGRHMAQWFGKELAAAGVEIISGMARGIDGIGQRAALAAGGYSLAVMGCGADICYPPENGQLYHALCEQGGVCSEYQPGTAPHSSLFPPRNRIISGLADAVVVIEAKDRSGTLITVDMALEQGREVFALPGRITEPLSEGCNRLLQQGASPALSPSEILRNLTGSSARSKQVRFPLGDVQIDLLQTLSTIPQSMEQIKEQVLLKYGRDLALPQLADQLVSLSLNGYARQIGNGYFIKS